MWRSTDQNTRVCTLTDSTSAAHVAISVPTSSTGCTQGTSYSNAECSILLISASSCVVVVLCPSEYLATVRVVVVVVAMPMGY